MFFEEHAKLLADFARVSQAAGARADYVQGGGGNTSVKLPGGLMAIKASGSVCPISTRIRHMPCWTARSAEFLSHDRTVRACGRRKRGLCPRESGRAPY